jgi:hypothetical protein
LRAFDDSGADWIAKNVSNDGLEVVVVLDWKGAEAALPDVSGPIALPLVAFCVFCHPSMDESAECVDILWFDDRVEVI